MSAVQTEDEFKITTKIEQLMVRIAEGNYTSINEMNLVFTSNGHVYKVLRGLIGLGFLSEVKTKMVPSKIYHLSPKGYEYLHQKGLLSGVGRFQAADFRMTMCFHHLTCLGVRVLFEDLIGASKWKTEKKLNYERSEMGIEGIRLIKRVTDAEFDLKNIHIGVEVEITLKSPLVLKKNIENLNERIRREDLQNIIWITRNDSVIQAIRRIYGIKELNRSVKLDDIMSAHLFINYEELVEKKGEALIMDLSGKIKVLKELN